MKVLALSSVFRLADNFDGDLADALTVMAEYVRKRALLEARANDWGRCDSKKLSGILSFGIEARDIDDLKGGDSPSRICLHLPALTHVLGDRTTCNRCNGTGAGPYHATKGAQVCTLCAGAGSYPSDNPPCHGDLRLECMLCLGYGSYAMAGVDGTCPECKGSGRIGIITNALGQGEIARYEVPEEDPRPTHPVSFDPHTNCPDCDGKGRTEVNHKSTGYEVRFCATCQGKGSFPTASGPLVVAVDSEPQPYMDNPCEWPRDVSELVESVIGVAEGVVEEPKLKHSIALFVRNTHHYHTCNNCGETHRDTSHFSYVCPGPVAKEPEHTWTTEPPEEEG